MKVEFRGMRKLENLPLLWKTDFVNGLYSFIRCKEPISEYLNNQLRDALPYFFENPYKRKRCRDFRIYKGCFYFREIPILQHVTDKPHIFLCVVNCYNPLNILIYYILFSIIENPFPAPIYLYPYVNLTGTNMTDPIGVIGGDFTLFMGHQLILKKDANTTDYVFIEEALNDGIVDENWLEIAKCFRFESAVSSLAETILFEKDGKRKLKLSEKVTKVLDEYGSKLFYQMIPCGLSWSEPYIPYISHWTEFFYPNHILCFRHYLPFRLFARALLITYVLRHPEISMERIAQKLCLSDIFTKTEIIDALSSYPISSYDPDLSLLLTNMVYSEF